MARKKIEVRAPYLDLDFRSHGDLLLKVVAPYEANRAPGKAILEAQMKVPYGIDRLAIATTLVELAAELLNKDRFLHGMLRQQAVVMVAEAIGAADKYIEKPPHDLPF